MTALLYFLVAVLAVVSSTHAWLSDRNDRARQAYLGLGWAIGLSHAAFALSLLPGLYGLRLLYMFAGTTIPAAALWTVDRIFARDSPGTTRAVGGIALATALIAPLTTGAHLVFGPETGHLSLAQIAAACWTAFAFGLVLWRIRRAYDDSDLQVDRSRLRVLFGVAALAIGFSLLEALARSLGGPVDPSRLSLASRVVALQGPIPPFSVIFTGIALYFTYYTITQYRLLDLRELASHAATLVLSAAVLVGVDGITFLWVDTFTVFPFHSTFQIFLGSLLFLAAYDPLRKHIQWLVNRTVNARGQRLLSAIEELRILLPSRISTDALVDTLLGRLHASGRVHTCSIYLWDPHLDAFVCTAWRGTDGAQPLKAVAAHPFTYDFLDQVPWYVRATKKRRARLDPQQGELLGLMEAMNADVTMPLMTGGVVLGWLNLRDEDWSDGFSLDELQRLAEIGQLASTVLSNIQDFRALEEEHRLAALGAMATGLAHEIRNPLAGVKGAAQYLQAEQPGEESREMLQVIIAEVDRLDEVVTQFLDYARPFDLTLRPDHLNAIVTHVLTLVRAQGIPSEITLIEDLSGDLPSFPVDSTKLSQVLLNLVRNALQAMSARGTLTIQTRRRAGRAGQALVEVLVRDTGRGIPEEHLEKLFVPFFTTKSAGTGLGLAISQRIIQAHGGEIDVQSEAERGSTFILRLPLPKVVEGQGDAEQPARPLEPGLLSEAS